MQSKQDLNNITFCHSASIHSILDSMLVSTNTYEEIFTP